MEEFEFIARAAQGDHEAFSVLTEQYLPGIYRRVLGTGADSDAAFDLTREIFLRAWHGVSLFQGDESFECWLERLADDVAGTPEPGWEDTGEDPVPEQLHGAIMRRIEGERSSAVWKESLRRFRFTLIALLLILIVLLFSRLSKKTNSSDPVSAPQPSASAAVTDIPEAALEPGA